MKHLTFLLLFVVSLGASAQKIEAKAVPAPVMSKFTAFYPKIAQVQWEKENEDYEASFKDANAAATSVLFTAEGNIREVETAIKPAALPKAISDTLPKTFHGYKIREVAKIDASGLITYEVEVKKKKEKLELVFSEKAALLKKTPVIEKKKEKEGKKKA